MKKLALGLSVATLVVGIMAGTLWSKLGAERTRLDELRAQVTALESAPKAAVAAAVPTAAATPAPAMPDSTIAVPPSAPGAATSTNDREKKIQQGLAKGISDVLASDAGRDLIKNQLRTALAAQFPDLATELRLTPAEADKFMDLLVNQASASAGDVLGMMGGPGGASADSQRKMLERQLANEKEIARTLGNKYPAWQEYQGTATAKQQVSQLRSLLGTGADALSETQSKPLIAALGVEQSRINKEEQDKMATAVRSSQPVNIIGDQLKSMTATNERLVNVASSQLSSTQLDRYKAMLKQQENMLRAVMGSIGGQGGAPK